MDLVNELQYKIKELYKATEMSEFSGKKLAEAERDYKVLLRQECLKLKHDGMAVGMIDKTCYGIPEVAEKRFQRDVAEAVYKASQENINAIKLEIKIIESQIQREYGNCKY